MIPQPYSRASSARKSFAAILAIVVVVQLILNYTAVSWRDSTEPFLASGEVNYRGDYTGDVVPRPPKKSDEPCYILFWTKWFGTKYLYEHPRIMAPCEHKCIMTADRSLLAKADAIVFHMRDISISDFPRKRKDQPWIMFTQEPWTYEMNYYFPMVKEILRPDFAEIVRRDITMLDSFDYIGSYELSTDFPFPYHGWMMSEPPEMTRKFGSELRPRQSLTYQVITQPFGADIPAPEYRKGLAAVIGNCDFDFIQRVELLREIAGARMFIDSLGRCARTVDGPPVTDIGNVARQYRFMISIENSNCKEYTTEKLFRNGLLYGALPVVDGADSYREVIPHDLAVLHVLEFQTPAHLAQYIALLNTRLELYALHVAQHKFRNVVKRSFSQKFFNADGSNNEKDYYFCRVSSAIRTGKWPRPPRRGAVTDFFRSFFDYRTSACGFNGNWVERIFWQRNGGPVQVMYPHGYSPLEHANGYQPVFYQMHLMPSRKFVLYTQLFVWNRLFHVGRCVRVWKSMPLGAPVEPRVESTSVGPVKHAIDPSQVFTALMVNLHNPRTELYVHSSEDRGFEIRLRKWVGDFTLESLGDGEVQLHNALTRTKLRVSLGDLTLRHFIFEQCPQGPCGLGHLPVDSVNPAPETIPSECIVKKET